MQPNQAILKKGHIDVTGMWRRLWVDAKAKALAAGSPTGNGIQADATSGKACDVANL